MASVVALIAAITLSLLITRIGSHALMLTGISRELARFQARSAFTGVGFTTSEAELVINHPVRRRIVMLLMLLGNAGVVTVVATLVLTFSQSGGTDQWLIRSFAILVGLFVLWIVSWNRIIDAALSRAIAWALKRWAAVDARDFASLLHLSSDYQVSELAVSEGDWLAHKPLGEARLRAEGVLVLGIQRKDGPYLGAPRGETKVRPGDTLTLYGRDAAISELDRRREDESGDEAHRQAEAAQEGVVLRERSRDADADSQHR